MALQTPIYRTAAQSVFVYRAEPVITGSIYFPPPESNTIIADALIGTMILVGYTNSPGYTKPNALQEVRSAGMRSVAKFVGGRQEPVQNVTLTLGNAAGVKTFLTKAFTATGASTHMCMPVIASAVASLPGCDAAATYQRLGRYGQINRLTLSFRVGQPVTAAVEIWPLFIDMTGSAVMPTVDPAAIRTAGGEVFMYSDAAIAFGSDDYTAHLRSFTITIDNMLTREGQRPWSQGGNLALKAGSIYSLGQRVSLQLDQAANLPDAFLDGTTMGTFTATMTLGAATITLASTAAYMDVDSMPEGDPAAALGFSSAIMLPDLTIA